MLEFDFDDEEIDDNLEEFKSHFDEEPEKTIF